MATRVAVETAARGGFRRVMLPTFAINLTPPPSSANVFISGLNKRTTTEGLREAFSKFGEVVNAKVVTDRVSGSSKGYGFFHYATTEEAKAGIQGMDGAFLDGWVIFAEFARPRSSPASRQPNGNPHSTTPHQ